MRRIRLIVVAVSVIALSLLATQPASATLTPSEYAVYFGSKHTMGGWTTPRTVTLSNHTDNDSYFRLWVGGPAADDFFVSTDCGTMLPPGGSCEVDIHFAPTNYGWRLAYLFHTWGVGVVDYQKSIQLAGTGDAGHYLIASDGVTQPVGVAPRLDTYSGPLNQPIVGGAATPSGRGLWTLAGDGGVFSAGDAQFYGSTGSLRLNKPVVGMAATPTGEGYWFVASDGGIFAYGDAGFYGSTGSLPLNQPIVGMAATPSGNGYWLVARDGGIFAFGDARFFGSTGSIKLNQPIVGMAPTATGNGYWFVAADGGVFAFGDAQFKGSAVGNAHAPVVSIAAAPVGVGYWIAMSSGHIRNFGSAPAMSGENSRSYVALVQTSHPPF